MDDQILQARKIHAQNLRESSSWLFYYFIFAVGVSLLAATSRAIPWGPLYYLGIPIFLLCFVAPHLVFPGPKHYSKRVAFLLVGLLLIATTGITFLGLVSAGWLILLITPVLSASLIGSRGAYPALAITLILPIGLGFLHSYGFIEANITDYQAHFSDWRNWMVMTTALLLSSLACLIVTQHLHRQWEATHLELHKQHDQFRALVEYAPEAILILDADLGVFITSNPRAEQILGYNRSELVGKLGPNAISPTFQPDGRRSEEAISIYAQQTLTGEFPIFEWQHETKAGQLLDCEISLARLPPFDRKLVRASVVEISARKLELQEHQKVQQQLAASQKLEAVGKLTGGVAHDFNNHLAVTLGNLELLRDETEDEHHKALIDKSIAATLRGSDLTRNMLAFARKASLEPQAIDINQVVHDTKNWTSRTLPTSISVHTSLLEGLWPVEADSSSTESALLNLILNARDAMPDGGDLTIETANIEIEKSYLDARQEELFPGRYVMLAVSDTGGGIPPETLPEIFEPFFSTKAVGSNSGLGLSMVHGFMRQSNGTVQVYSELGVGTTFKLFFKVAADISPSASSPKDNTNTTKGGGQRVLVAEDDSAVLDVLLKTLEKAGYSAIAATSGDAAKAIFEADPDFDLLITDIVMPGKLLGTTLASVLRAQAPDLPVIFMSGYASEATVHGNGLRPEDIRLMKPVQRVELMAAIHKALG
ncbi:ATP-binding protein [Pseudophaeobacter sp.]|uniref:ATP-binding protein n=1 Tax=Pseudophaeobacter sp. TaxID=1971739 RepID=UPI003296A931